MSSYTSKEFLLPLSIGLAVGMAISGLWYCKQNSDQLLYSLPDQPKRFANAKATNNRRVLDIDAYYNPAFLSGKTVLVTGQRL